MTLSILTPHFREWIDIQLLLKLTQKKRRSRMSAYLIVLNLDFSVCCFNFCSVLGVSSLKDKTAVVTSEIEQLLEQRQEMCQANFLLLH